MILFNTNLPFFLLDEAIYVVFLFSPVCSTKNENKKPNPKKIKKGKTSEKCDSRLHFLGAGFF